MLLIDCPHCGPRAEIEFRHAGEAHLVRPVDGGGNWGDYLYLRDNIRGRAHERWRHAVGCGQFFNAVRDTVSDAIEGTYEALEGPRIGAEVA